MPDTGGTPRALGTSAMIDYAVSRLGISREVFFRRSHIKRASTARYAVMFAARQRGLRLEQIGRILQRHHTTVMNGLMMAERLLAEDEEFARLTAALIDLVPPRRLPS